MSSSRSSVASRTALGNAGALDIFPAGGLRLRRLASTQFGSMSAVDWYRPRWTHEWAFKEIRGLLETQVCIAVVWCC